MSELKKLVIAGAGLAGIGCALRARQCNKDLAIVVLEKRDQVLPWIDRKGLRDYPMGTTLASRSREDVSPQSWSAADSLLQKWNSDMLKDFFNGVCTEGMHVQNGRIVINEPHRLRGFFETLLDRHRIGLDTAFPMESFSRQGDGAFRIWSRDGRVHRADHLILATGGERNHGMKLAREQGADIADPVAGYVRLKLASRKYAERMGTVQRQVKIRLPKSGKSACGKLSLTVRGLEGPAISSLSVSECHHWHQLGYNFPIEVDWLPGLANAKVSRELLNRKEQGGKRTLVETPMFSFTSRSWRQLLKASRIDEETAWGRVRIKKLQALGNRLKCERLTIAGMGLPDIERAWAGGVDLQWLDQLRLESPVTAGLFFAGEILDFLGQPGGQHQDLVWASSCIAAQAASQSTP